MNQQLTVLVALIGLSLPAFAGEEPAGKQPAKRPPVTKKTADPLPDGMARFNGMVIGRLVKKDVEKGTFIVNVDAVPRVWRNSKAKSPKSIVGKNVEVDGVFGKWLDVLLLVKEGETIECEARHDTGDRLTFPGELLRKATPVKPGDFPELPEAFRGFHGFVVGKIVKKDGDLLELIMKVDKVKDTSEKNRAKNPESIVDKKVMLAGFWQRKEAYHGLKVGDTVECALQHISVRSDHINVGEFRKVKEAKPASKKSD